MNIEEPILYHATYGKLLKKIKLHGLVPGNYRNWDDSRNCIYLSTDRDVAASFAEASDLVPEDWIDDIWIISIRTSDLDTSLIFLDTNVIDNNGESLEYHANIDSSSFVSIEPYE